MITLRPITRDNYRQCLSVKVAPAQVKFIAPNWFSLAQAAYESECVPLAIYNDDDMVGFAMHAIDIEDGHLWVYRLMIAEAHQRKGYGSAAMRLLLDNFRRDGKYSTVYISFEPENEVACALYQTLGFRLTGQILDGEAVMVCELGATGGAE